MVVVSEEKTSLIRKKTVCFVLVRKHRGREFRKKQNQLEDRNENKKNGMLKIETSFILSHGAIRKRRRLSEREMRSHVEFTRGFPIAVKLEPAKRRYTALDLIQDVEKDPDLCSFLDSLCDAASPMEEEKEEEKERKMEEPPPPPPPPRRFPHHPPHRPSLLPPSPIPFPSSLSLFSDEESI